MSKRRRKAKAKPTGMHAFIRARRRELDMTQEQLAARIVDCGGELVDFTAVSHWENGQRPEIARLPSLAAALKTTVAELIDGEDWPAVEALIGMQAA